MGVAADHTITGGIFSHRQFAFDANHFRAGLVFPGHGTGGKSAFTVAGAKCQRFSVGLAEPAEARDAGFQWGRGRGHGGLP